MSLADPPIADVRLNHDKALPAAAGDFRETGQTAYERHSFLVSFFLEICSLTKCFASLSQGLIKSPWTENMPGPSATKSVDMPVWVLFSTPGSTPCEGQVCLHPRMVLTRTICISWSH
jgi:hypothetical protein